MKLLIASVFTMTGLAKATQAPYSMTRALALVPFEDVENKNYQLRGQGFSAVELSVVGGFANALQAHFDTAFKGMPLEMELKTSMDKQGRNIITGFITGKN